MKQILCIFFKILMVLLFASCSSLWDFNFWSSGKENASRRDIEDLLIGWEAMIGDIENHSKQMDDLSGKKYFLKLVLEGEWDLRVFPEESFSVKKILGGFQVKVKNGPNLFEDTTGLVKRRYIEAKLTKRAGEKGGIQITGKLDCFFPVTFYQTDGTKVNFDRLSEGYEYKFIISDPNEVQIESKDAHSVTFVRKKPGHNDVSVSLWVKDKGTGEEFKGNPLYIPACIREWWSVDQTRRLPRSPGQCLVHLRGGTKIFDDSSGEFTGKEVLGNNCAHSIQCFFKVKYGFANRSKIVKAHERSFSTRISPMSWVEVDTTGNFTPPVNGHDSKVYNVPRLEKSAIPPRFQGRPKEEFFFCRWDKSKK